MQDGKKAKAETIVYDALAILAERTGKDPVEALEASIKSLTPALEVRSRRVGGAAHQVPVRGAQRRAPTLAARAPRARAPPPPCRRRDLPGARRGAPAPCPHARRALARRVRAQPPREVDGPAARPHTHLEALPAERRRESSRRP